MRFRVAKLSRVLCALLVVLGVSAIARADPYDDCVLQNLKGVTSDVAALNIRIACASKYRRLVELSDISFLQGYANFNPPMLVVTVNNRSDFTVAKVTIYVKNKKSGATNYYDLLTLNQIPQSVAQFEPRKITEAGAGIIERGGPTQNFFDEYQWGIARAYAYGDGSSSDNLVKCTDEEWTHRNGDCWIRLTSREKSILVFAITAGVFSDDRHSEQQQYQTLGRRVVGFFWVPPDNLQRRYDEIYRDPANRGIGFDDAYDLAERLQVHKMDDPELTLLVELYRSHKHILFSGYLRRFIPPNKVIISEWNDAPSIKRGPNYDNPQQTMTLLGLDDRASNPALAKFMSALVNVKACQSLVKITDRYKYMKSASDQERQQAKEMDELTFSMRLPVIINYPAFSNEADPDFFNEKGELSGEVLIDKSAPVCEDISGPFPHTIYLVDIMLWGDKRDTNERFGPIFFDNAKLLNLNEYILANKLQPPGDGANDPRIMARHYYAVLPSPSPSGVARTLEVGASVPTAKQ